MADTRPDQQPVPSILTSGTVTSTAYGEFLRGLRVDGSATLEFNGTGTNNTFRATGELPPVHPRGLSGAMGSFAIETVHPASDGATTPLKNTETADPATLLARHVRRGVQVVVLGRWAQSRLAVDVREAA